MTYRAMITTASTYFERPYKQTRSLLEDYQIMLDTQLSELELFENLKCQFELSRVVEAKHEQPRQKVALIKMKELERSIKIRARQLQSLDELIIYCYHSQMKESA